MTTLCASRHWHAEVQPDGVVLHAGADQTYLLRELPATDAAQLVELFEPSPDGTARRFDPRCVPGAVRRVIPQLRTLGALRPTELPTGPAVRLGIHWVGQPVTELASRLAVVDDPVDLLVVVRTTGRWQDVITLAAELTGPHLLLDLAYHHSASIGPLVVPGQTACLACLANRISWRWNDPEPPAEPRTTSDPELPAALVVHAARRIGEGSLALLEKIVTYDLDELTSTAEHVLPSAGCPVCPQLPVGKVELPWEVT